MLSEQALVDCAWPEGNNGCDGGMDDGAYRWAAAHGGLPTAAAYGPYLNADGACHARDVAAADKVRVAGFARVRPAAADVRDALARKGPLSVALYAKARALAPRFWGLVGDEAQAPSPLRHIPSTSTRAACTRPAPALPVSIAFPAIG